MTNLRLRSGWSEVEVRSYMLSLSVCDLCWELATDWPQIASTEDDLKAYDEEQNAQGWSSQELL